MPQIDLLRAGAARKNAGAVLIPLRRCVSPVQDFLQHLAQPAASVQHFVHVAWSLQHEPLQDIAGLEQEPFLQFAQPVVRKIPATATNASVIIVFI